MATPEGFGTTVSGAPPGLSPIGLASLVVTPVKPNSFLGFAIVRGSLVVQDWPNLRLVPPYNRYNLSPSLGGGICSWASCSPPLVWRPAGITRASRFVSGARGWYTKPPGPTP